MTTASITWPAGLPQRPLAEGYAEGFEDNTIRSAPDKGASKTRPRFTRLRPLRTGVSYLLTDAQKTLFDAFYESISGGALPFNWPDPVSDSPIVVLLKSNAVGPRRVSANRWRITLELEVLP